MNKTIPLLLLILISAFSKGQDSLRYRVILIGDAGEMNPEQQKALQHAANHIISGKTVVLYLGDNVYPHGMGLPGSKEETTTQQILASQYQPMRAKGAPVYFVPGNHDWDKMGPLGLAKIKRQWQYLESQGDSLLKLIPANGCPDPVEINLTDSLTIIAYDSEWWLFPFRKSNPDGECDCKTKKDVLARLEELQYKNRNKVILLAGHHPFESYGVHGGVFTFKDHLFPLTAVNKNLYIPLPLIGSLYPFLRSTLTNPEDLKHPWYKDMIKRIDGVFATNPNMVHVAGHEHGLQFIKNKEQIQVVSGAGAKHTNASKGKYSLFADATQGYVTADLLIGNTLRFTYYVYTNDTIQQAFRYDVPYTTVTATTALADTTRYKDSVTVRIHPSYDKPGKFHRFFFGENYRKEWAAPVTLPVIRISEISGGLTPLQLGGGMQSTSLRLEDKTGKEWVLRSVEKTTDALLPEALQDAFARDWLDDVTSAQHPFAALAVPPIADAVHVPHSNPVIGVVAPDKNLLHYENKFKNLVVVLEEREPLGKGDNSEKMKKNLVKDNENHIQGKEFLRARMLDAYLGDWDRHEDQWRWFDATKKGKEKDYVAVPRDRDQVFHLTQGFFPVIASQAYILPTLRDFDRNIGHAKWLLFKTRFVNAYPDFQFSRQEWAKEAKAFQQAITDSVLEAALKRLPAPAYHLRHDVLLQKLQARRSRLPEAMDEYYRFTQKIADIQTSDKNELVQINDTTNGDLRVRISRINKNGEIREQLMDKTYEKAFTKEIRLFLRNGTDSVLLDNKTSPIKLRIVGGHDTKAYDIVNSRNKVRLYDRPGTASYSGETNRLCTTVSNDSLNTAFTPVNLYNTTMPLALIGLNKDDGFILGAGARFVRQEGFRKYPYASMQQILIAHSFSTAAYSLNYTGEWIHAVGKADFTINTDIKAPDNTINFFGRGNETEFNKTGDFVRYYRTRFSIYQVNPALRWRGNKAASISIGPSLSYYIFDKDGNGGRFITNTSKIGSYDSSIIDKNKLHLGAIAEFTSDNRNNKIVPQWGSFIRVRIQGYKGMNGETGSFAQLMPEVSLYKNLNAKATIILANRFGGTVSVGKTAFYQSAFIGGQGNLLGYRQYRFAGQHSMFNNLEMRIKLADVASYILPGQLGITGFWDIGRVWEKNEDSGKWHNGTGGGIYFAPVSLVAFSFVMGNSAEGWYPYFSMGFRF